MSDDIYLWGVSLPVLAYIDAGVYLVRTDKPMVVSEDELLQLPRCAEVAAPACRKKAVQAYVDWAERRIQELEKAIADHCK